MSKDLMLVKCRYGFHYHRCPDCKITPKYMELLQPVKDVNGHNLDLLRYCPRCKSLFEIKLGRKLSDEEKARFELKNE